MKRLRERFGKGRKVAVTCGNCNGVGKYWYQPEGESRWLRRCPKCKGKGKIWI